MVDTWLALVLVAFVLVFLIVVTIGVVVIIAVGRKSRQPTQFICPKCEGNMMTGKVACPHCGVKFG